MSQRRFGPTLGAGVAVVELEGDKPVEPGALGMVAYAGILEKGQVGELIFASSKTAFLKRCGSYIPDSLLPDACIDYFDGAAGAGGLWLVRVTDGDEAQAELKLYGRRDPKVLVGTIKAKNGGRWGGKAAKLTDDLAASGDLTEVTLDTKTTMKADQWKGGYIELEVVPNARYTIVGNTAAGVVTVVADATMKTAWGTGPSLRYYLVLENEGKCLTVEVKDGVEKPNTEFGLYVYVNGVLASFWENLSMDPASSRFWENTINNDGRNDEIVVTDEWTGGIAADIRPANVYAKIGAVTTTTLTSVIHKFNPALVGDANGTCVLGTTNDAMVAQEITLTFSGATTAAAVSDKFGALGDVTVGTAFVPNNKWAPGFTLTAGTSVWAAADQARVSFSPFIADELIGGVLFPDKVNFPKEFYRIVDNTHKVITVAAGSDLTISGAPDDYFMVAAPVAMSGGRDGVAGLTDADYEDQAWDVGSSPFNQLRGKNAGLVKLATPGVTSTSVQKTGVAYASAKNYQYRYEVPANKVTEVDVDTYVNDTVGRNDFAVVSFPSYGYVADPEANEAGKLKLVSLTGQIHGKEARIAVDYNGYHKAAAGTDAILAKILKLTTGDAILDEEYLNPKGINLIKKVKGNFVLWGDRTLWVDPTWKWKHQREQMTYYEQTLIENFDWIIFAINDPIEEKRALSALKSFFLPEWSKRALRGNTFDQACSIKIDAENNTDATRAAGDMNAEIKLRLADTVERFVMKIGKQGLFESVG